MLTSLKRKAKRIYGNANISEILYAKDFPKSDVKKCGCTNILGNEFFLIKEEEYLFDPVLKYRVYTTCEVKQMQFRIGELADKCNVNKETIRYYERIGLITEPSRTDSGYRIYPEQTADRITFIKRMQELGFVLNEIDKLLGVVDRDEVKCRDMYDFTVQKIEDIQRKIEGLRRIERMLVDLKERCPENKDI